MNYLFKKQIWAVSGPSLAPFYRRQGKQDAKFKLSRRSVNEGSQISKMFDRMHQKFKEFTEIPKARVKPTKSQRRVPIFRRTQHHF